MKKQALFVLPFFALTLSSCGESVSSALSDSSKGGTTSTGSVSPSTSSASSNSMDLPGYNLIWNDEFDGTELDSNYWNYEIGGSGWGNNELEYYTNKNATVADGVLSIQAKKEDYQGKNYTSSRITTAKKAYTTYGRIEAKIKLDAQNAMWPAFWMMPENNVYWPYSGEIDIMENKGSDALTTSSALHHCNSNGDHIYEAGSYGFSQRQGEGTIEDWHVYDVVWDEEEFNFYVDDHLKLNVPKRTWHPAGGATYTSDDDFPFNKDFYVILNLAIGGNFDSAHTAPDSDFTSATMQVDYVRMYEFK
jgi:beta-glucanase (GH16 family)